MIMTVGKLIEKLQMCYEPEDAIAAPIWLAGDVWAAGRRIGIELSDAQCRKVLGYIQDHHDPELGITWLTISEALRDKVWR